LRRERQRAVRVCPAALLLVLGEIPIVVNGETARQVLREITTSEKVSVRRAKK
jgi:hypothetical protein